MDELTCVILANSNYMMQRTVASTIMHSAVLQGPYGGGFDVRKGNDGELLSESLCNILGVPLGSKWGAGPSYIVKGHALLFLFRIV